MTDAEKILLIMKFNFDVDFHLKNEYINELNTFILTPNTSPYDFLELYRKKVRYESFRDFSSNIDKILYGR